MKTGFIGDLEMPLPSGGYFKLCDCHQQCPRYWKTHIMFLTPEGFQHIHQMLEDGEYWRIPIAGCAVWEFDKEAKRLAVEPYKPGVTKRVREQCVALDIWREWGEADREKETQAAARLFRRLA